MRGNSKADQWLSRLTGIDEILLGPMGRTDSMRCISEMKQMLIEEKAVDQGNLPS